MAMDLYHTDSVLGWRVIRRISCQDAEKKVELGVMRRVLDGAGNHIGYQPVAPAAARMDMDVPSQPSPVTIMRGQMEMNAVGRSRTMGMSEAKRLERAASIDPNTGKHRDAEDRIERVQRKVQVYARVGAAKGDILRAWPRNAAEPVGAA